MFPELEKIPRTPPYALILWALNRLKLSVEKVSFRSGISMEIFQEILDNKKEIDIILSEKLAKGFQIEDVDYFFNVQKSWNKELEYQKQPKPTPNLANIRPYIFWDTIFEKIDWIRAEKGIIQRIFERGNEFEKQEIISFYGKEKIIDTLQNFCNQNLTENERQNIHQYRIPIAFGKFLQAQRHKRT